MIKKISGNTFPKEIENGVAVVDFSATWCGPCKMIEPVLEELAKELEGKIQFYNADVDENSKLAEQYGIMSIPAIVILKDGQKKEMQVGFQPKERLMEFFGKFI